jgi:large subunit ribosomal protein L18
VDDEKGVTLASSSDVQLKSKGTLGEKASAIGADIAKKGKKQKVGSAVFDRGGFDYGGRIKILADAARGEGLVF